MHHLQKFNLQQQGIRGKDITVLVTLCGSSVGDDLHFNKWICFASAKSWAAYLSLFSLNEYRSNTESVVPVTQSCSDLHRLVPGLSVYQSLHPWSFSPGIIYSFSSVVQTEQLCLLDTSLIVVFVYFVCKYTKNEIKCILISSPEITYGYTCSSFCA